MIWRSSRKMNTNKYLLRLYYLSEKLSKFSNAQKKVFHAFSLQLCSTANSKFYFYFHFARLITLKFRQYQKQSPRGVLEKRCSENMPQIYRRTPISKCDFNKVAKQLYWYHTSAWVFSCKFVAYFQNTFSQEHLWVAASAIF